MNVAFLEENIGFVEKEDGFPSDCILEDLFESGFKLLRLCTKVTTADGEQRSFLVLGNTLWGLELASIMITVGFVSLPAVSVFPVPGGPWRRMVSPLPLPLTKSLNPGWSSMYACTIALIIFLYSSLITSLLNAFSRKVTGLRSLTFTNSTESP